MRHLARHLGALVFVATLVGWSLVAEAAYDLFPARDGLGDFNAQFEVELSERPVLRKLGGFVDLELYYRLRVTPEELEEIVRGAELAEVDGVACLTSDHPRAVWWRPTSASRRRCFQTREPDEVWLDVLYDPAGGVLYAFSVGP